MTFEGPANPSEIVVLLFDIITIIRSNGRIKRERHLRLTPHLERVLRPADGDLPVRNSTVMPSPHFRAPIRGSFEPLIASLSVYRVADCTLQMKSRQ